MHHMAVKKLEHLPAPDKNVIVGITVQLKSRENRFVNYTFARIKRDAAMEIARKIGVDKAKELFAKTKGLEYNQRTGDYSYYFHDKSARQFGDSLIIKFRNPNELEIEFAEYIKSNPSSVNGFNPKN